MGPLYLSTCLEFATNQHGESEEIQRAQHLSAQKGACLESIAKERHKTPQNLGKAIRLITEAARGKFLQGNFDYIQIYLLGYPKEIMNLVKDE